MRVGTLESRRIEAHEARDSPTRRRRMVARPASGRDPQPELAASRMTSGPRANRRWSSGRGAITPSPARDGSPPGLAGERLRRSRPLRLPREGAKRRPGAARRPDRRPAHPVSRASELGPPAQDPSREDATHAERVGHGRQSDLPRLRAGTDLARRPVHVDSDYLLHRRCWNPSAEAMLARELKQASGP